MHTSKQRCTNTHTHTNLYSCVAFRGRIKRLQCGNVPLTVNQADNRLIEYILLLFILFFLLLSTPRAVVVSRFLHKIPEPRSMLYKEKPLPISPETEKNTHTQIL